jgi:hypothetical protein
MHFRSNNALSVLALAQLPERAFNLRSYAARGCVDLSKETQSTGESCSQEEPKPDQEGGEELQNVKGSNPLPCTCQAWMDGLCQGLYSLILS